MFFRVDGIETCRSVFRLSGNLLVNIKTEKQKEQKQENTKKENFIVVIDEFN